MNESKGSSFSLVPLYDRPQFIHGLLKAIALPYRLSDMANGGRLETPVPRALPEVPLGS